MRPVVSISRYQLARLQATAPSLRSLSTRFPRTPSPTSTSPPPTTTTATITRPTNIPISKTNNNYNFQPPHQTMSSSAIPTPTPRFKLVFFVPHTHLEPCKEAIFATGAGTIGNYAKCAFQMPGTGQFLPADGADPAIGKVGALETVEEMKVEILCEGREGTQRAVSALVQAHPYEEVAYEVYRVEDF